MKATEISQFSKDHLWGPFPSEDCRFLASIAETDQLTPDLDIFFAEIAGFAHGATSLAERSEEQIDRGLRTLAHSFFNEFPDHAHLAKLITAEATPKLFAQLNAAELLRAQLLELLKQAKANKHGKASTQ